MNWCGKGRIALLGAVLAIPVSAADKDKPVFRPGPANSYPNHQTVDGVTAAADVFETEEKARSAFGKVNPYQHGVLPVLVVLKNETAKVVDLSGLRAEYLTPGRERVEATPPEEVPYVYGNRGRKVRQNPIPSGPISIGGKKNPLTGVEIPSRAFSARMLPPGESASGFFYFQVGHRNKAKLYLTGMKDAASGRDLFFIEIDLPDVAR